MLSLNHLFQLKAIFLHHTHLYLMKLQQGKEQVWDSVFSKSLSSWMKNYSSERKHKVRWTGSSMTSGLTGWSWEMSEILLACLGTSNCFQPEPVMQLCFTCIANVVGKCSWSGRCWYTSVVWGIWHDFCPAPARCGIHPCVCCKRDLRKRNFSFPQVTKILLWALGEPSSPRPADTLWCMKWAAWVHPADWENPAFVLDSVNQYWARWTHMLAGQESHCLRWWEMRITSGCPSRQRDTQALALVA